MEPRRIYPRDLPCRIQLAIVKRVEFQMPKAITFRGGCFWNYGTILRLSCRVTAYELSTRGLGIRCRRR